MLLALKISCKGTSITIFQLIPEKHMCVIFSKFTSYIPMNQLILEPSSKHLLSCIFYTTLYVHP